MPTFERREDKLIEYFLSKRDRGLWANAAIDWVDKRIDGGVDALATRTSDGSTLAIEHTIIEPFAGEKSDFVQFEAALLGIEQDSTLPVPGQWMQVFVPVGLCNRRTRAEKKAITSGIHHWIKAHRLRFGEGAEEHVCRIEIPGVPPLPVKLTVVMRPLTQNPRAGSGVIHVRRQHIQDDLPVIIEKALRTKVPKLIATPADRHALLLERQHLNLPPRQILDEVERQASTFAPLSRVDELWIAETIFYGTAFGGNHVRFEQYKSGRLVQAFDAVDD